MAKKLIKENRCSGNTSTFFIFSGNKGYDLANLERQNPNKEQIGKHAGMREYK